MALRDIAVFLVVTIGIPFILRNPAVGIGYWVWLSLMNPHRATWGFAYSFPFAFVVLVATVVGLFLTKEPRGLKGGAAAWILLAFVMWMCFTTLFALEPDRAIKMLERVVKIMFVTFVALYTLYKREHVMWLVLICALSVAFYGVKGGVFTIVRGGENLVWGPPESFIADNNALALAVIMTIPLLAYFYIMATKSLDSRSDCCVYRTVRRVCAGQLTREEGCWRLSRCSHFCGLSRRASCGWDWSWFYSALAFFPSCHRNGKSGWIRLVHMSKTDRRVPVSRPGPC